MKSILYEPNFSKWYSYNRAPYSYIKDISYRLDWQPIYIKVQNYLYDLPQYQNQGVYIVDLNDVNLEFYR